MRNFRNFAAFDTLEMTGFGRHKRTSRTTQRPAKTDFVIRLMSPPPGHFPPTLIETGTGNLLSWKYVLNLSAYRVESRSVAGDSTLGPSIGALLWSSVSKVRHGLCSYLSAGDWIQSFVSVTNEETVA